MASIDDVKAAIYGAIVEQIEQGAKSSGDLKNFAEATAWLRQPAGSHPNGS